MGSYSTITCLLATYSLGALSLPTVLSGEKYFLYTCAQKVICKFFLALSYILSNSAVPFTTTYINVPVYSTLASMFHSTRCFVKCFGKSLMQTLPFGFYEPAVKEDILHTQRYVLLHNCNTSAQFLLDISHTHALLHVTSTLPSQTETLCPMC